MKIKSAEFLRSAPSLATCPPTRYPEFAFIGRSNVGKSSLLNLLAERRNLALVSGTPGKTKLMNFFVINHAWCLVDLPGYGYAKVGKGDRADFNEAAADYMEHRASLRCVFVLIDSRHPPQAIDVEFLTWLGERALPYALVFTKTDKLSAAQVAANLARFREEVYGAGVGGPEMFATSATTKQGRAELARFIGQEVNAKPAKAKAGDEPDSTLRRVEDGFVRDDEEA